jgi:threonine synthase
MLTHLECTRCGEHYFADRPQSVCSKDGGILYARYDLPTIKRAFSSARLAGRAPTMWRYDAVLPDANPVSLGEGFTCRAALINENCIGCVFSTFSFLSASGMALNHKKLGT